MRITNVSSPEATLASLESNEFFVIPENDGALYLKLHNADPEPREVLCYCFMADGGYPYTMYISSDMLVHPVFVKEITYYHK